MTDVTTLRNKIAASAGLTEAVVTFETGGIVLKSNGKKISPRSYFVLHAYASGIRVDEHGSVRWINGDEVKTVFFDGSGKLCFSLKVVHAGIKAPVQIHRLVGYQKFGDAALVRGAGLGHADGDVMNNKPENIVMGCKVVQSGDQKINPPGSTPSAVVSPELVFEKRLFPALSHDMLFVMGVSTQMPYGDAGPEFREIVFVAPPFVFVVDRDLKPKANCFRCSDSTQYLVDVAFAYAGKSRDACTIVVPDNCGVDCSGFGPHSVVVKPLANLHKWMQRTEVKFS